MISYAEAPLPEPSLSPNEQATNDHILLAMAKVITEEHQKKIDRVFATAILEANGGVPPTEAEMRKWGRTLVMADGTVMLAWKAPDWDVGEPVDMSYVIAKVGPPEI
jgi:hypothetical protein